MKNLISVLILVFGSIAIYCQEVIDCSQVLSEAEEAFRNGNVNGVKNIYKCLGVRKIGDSTRIYPTRMRILVKELELLDSNTIQDLSGFNDFGSFLRKNAAHKSYEKELRENLKSKFPDHKVDSLIERRKESGSFDHQYFSQNENRKAYMLLVQTYIKLKSLDHAKFIANRYLNEYPTVPIIDSKDNLVFKQVADLSSKGIRRLSFGLSFGTNISIPKPLTLNVDIKDETTRLLAGFSIGGHARFYFNENFSFGFGIVGTSNHIRLSGKINNSETFNYKHDESMRWLKIPFTLKWITEKENKEHVPIEAKFFINAGFALARLTSSTAEIGFPSGTYGMQPTLEVRNKHNIEAILGGGMRVRLGRSYLSFGLNGNWALWNYQNMDLLGVEENPVYGNFGYMDNSYKLFSLGFDIGIEYRINLIPKSYRDNLKSASK